MAEHGPSERGFLGSTRYEVLDNPDMLIEIAEWDSAEARAAHMEEAAATGAYEPLLEMLGRTIPGHGDQAAALTAHSSSRSISPHRCIRRIR